MSSGGNNLTYSISGAPGSSQGQGPVSAIPVSSAGGSVDLTTAPVDLSTASPLVSSLLVNGGASGAGAGPNAVGFQRAQPTPFDDAVSKLFDATQVLGCQLMDEIIRDLQSNVEHYHIPPSMTCADFYAWLDNQAVGTIGKYMNAYQTLLTGLGLGALPDNMGDQLNVMRDNVLGVMRAAIDPVCANPATPTLDKQIIQSRLKQLQGQLCAANPAAGAGVFPVFERNPITGATTIVTADGTRINLHLDNSASNANNLANLFNNNAGSSSSTGFDPNVLAALLLANNINNNNQTASPAPTVGDLGSVAPASQAPADASSASTTAPLLDLSALTPPPTPPPNQVPTMMGIGPIALVMVVVLLVIGGIVAWKLRKGGAKGVPLEQALDRSILGHRY